MGTNTNPVKFIHKSFGTIVRREIDDAKVVVNAQVNKIIKTTRFEKACHVRGVVKNRREIDFGHSVGIQKVVEMVGLHSILDRVGRQSRRQELVNRLFL
jgi:hypothetical protein